MFGRLTGRKKRNADLDGGRAVLTFAALVIIGICLFVVFVQIGYNLGLALIEWIDREPHVHPHCRGLYRSSEDSNIKCPIRRLPPNFSRCRPNYYIAGTPKGGTTSLHTYLTEHPRVYPYAIRGRPSDGESFTRLYKTGHRKAFSKHHHHLEDLKDDQIVGDATVSRIIEDGYSNFRDYACNQSKIILLLRDPIERCYSYHLMNHRLGVTKVDPYYDDDVHENVQLNSVSEVMERELREFQYEVKKHPEIATKLFDEEDPLFNPSMNCLYEGAYVVHLRRLMRTHGGISRDRVRIYWSEEFFANPRDILADAMAFVGVDPSDVDLDDATSEKYNTRPDKEGQQKNIVDDDPCIAFPQSLREEMEQAMHPFNEQLEEFLGERPPWMMKKSTHIVQ